MRPLATLLPVCLLCLYVYLRAGDDAVIEIRSKAVAALTRQKPILWRLIVQIMGRASKAR